MSKLLKQGSGLRCVSLSVSVLALVGVVLLSGCTAPKSTNLNSSKVLDQNPKVVQQDRQSKTMDDFSALLGNKPTIGAVVAFIDQNISLVSKEQAAKLVIALEERQRSGLPILEEKYNHGESIQNKLNKVYQPGFDLNKIDGIKDQEVKDLLIETRDSGYKVETAEGMYFPIINYQFHKKYTPYLTTDLKDYLEIMAVESDKVPAKDAALVIGWDEVIKRVLTQESFLRNHASSAKVADMQQLQQKYCTFMLYGANNTPLFSYETKKMLPEAKTIYQKAVQNNGDSALMQRLNEYLKILAKTDYQLSPEAEQFREGLGKITLPS